MVYTLNWWKGNLIIRHNASKETGCQKRLGHTVIKVKTTLAQDCSDCNTWSTSFLHVYYRQLLKRTCYCCIYFHGFQKGIWKICMKKYVCRCYIYILKYTSLLDLNLCLYCRKTSADAQTVILLDDFRKLVGFSDMICSNGRRWYWTINMLDKIAWLRSYVWKRRPGAGRVP